MAVVLCKSCGKKISDKAGPCPFCKGDPISASFKSPSSSYLKRSIFLILTILAVGTIIAIITVAFMPIKTNIQKESHSVVTSLNTKPETEPIAHAFGKQLGAGFFPEESTAKGYDDKNIPLYHFNPQNPLPFLTGYSVQITPITRLIFRIEANSAFDSSQECLDNGKFLLSMLGEKYGKAGELDEHIFYSTSANVSQGNRLVTVVCSDAEVFSYKKNLTLAYEDLKLKKQAETERLKMKSEQVNSSGL